MAITNKAPNRGNTRATALRVNEATKVEAAIREAAGTLGTFLIDFAVDPDEKVYPMVPPGASLSKFMEETAREAV